MRAAVLIVVAGLTGGFVGGRACARQRGHGSSAPAAAATSPAATAPAAAVPRRHPRIPVLPQRKAVPPTVWQAYVSLDPDLHQREESAIAESLLGPWLEAPLRCRQAAPDPEARIELVLDLETSPDAIDAHRVEVGTVTGDVSDDVLACVRAALPPTLHVARGEPSTARPYRGPFTINL